MNNLEKKCYLSMHRVIYTPSAQEDMRSIFSYISSDNPHYAEEVISRIERSVLFLESFPLIGTEIGTHIRMIVEPRYRYKIVYTIIGKTVYVTGISKFQDAWQTRVFE